MNKILNSEIKKFKEWYCGKELINDYICGDYFNKRQHIICNDCLLELKVRKAKIESLRKDLIKLKAERINGEIALNVGFNKMGSELDKKIEEIMNGRD